MEAFPAYCDLKGYRAPSADNYGWARLAQVIGNYFGGTLSIGIDRYECVQGAAANNGVYVIEGWEIVDREYPYDNFHEQMKYDLQEMLKDIDKAQPKEEQLGSFLDCEDVPIEDVQIGDKVWKYGLYGWQMFEVVGFGEGWVNGADRTGKPYVNNYEKDGDYSHNANNYLDGATVRVVKED